MTTQGSPEEQSMWMVTCPDCDRVFVTDWAPDPNEVCAECFDKFNGITIEELIG